MPGTLKSGLHSEYINLFGCNAPYNYGQTSQDADYHRMPFKYHLDRLLPCLGIPGGVYCTAHADIVSDQPNELLNMMQAYSAHHTHFNYTNIKYGLCITKSCKQMYGGDSSEPALWNTTEACLNHTLSSEYDLKVRVTDLDCYRHGHKYDVNLVDCLLLTVLGAILVANVVGSAYDIWIRDEAKPGNKLLLSFSIRANWRRLVAPASSDPHQVRLQSMNGIRAISSILVILGHIPMVTINASVNPKDFEKTFPSLPRQILHHGHMITLTFFTMSGFLLSYNMEVRAEKQKDTWRILPMTLLHRWIRFSPANLVILMMTAVWYKFITIGPLFKEYVLREASDCRQYWLYNVLYATNWIDHSQCNLQVWSLSSDLQIYIICLAAIVLAPNVRARRWALAALYALGIGWPAYLIYSMDLDGTYLVTPTITNGYFTTSPTFNLIFKTTITNLPCYVIGVWFGYLVYDMQRKNLFTVSYRKYRLAYWGVVALLFVDALLCYVSYVDGPRPPLLLRLLLGPVVRSLFGIIINLIILGAICKCDDLVRGILEWRGWMPITRISYCLYLVHMMVIRYTGGSRDSLDYYSDHHVAQEYFGIACMSMIYATLLHLMVELPFAQLSKILFSRGARSAPDQLQPNSETHKPADARLKNE